MNISQHFGKFTNLPQASRTSLLAIADGHFHSIDNTTGHEVFAINRGLAHWLLHNCEHEVPPLEKARSASILAHQYSTSGAKTSWPKKPIVINCDEARIEDGVTRLYAIAYAQTKGVCMPIVFKTEINDEEEGE